jgi:hypothetical protein
MAVGMISAWPGIAAVGVLHVFHNLLIDYTAVAQALVPLDKFAIVSANSDPTQW